MDGKIALPDEFFDALVVGAGPTGLACAIEIERIGLRAVLVDRGCLCNSLFHYPSNMTFFTTPELLEIGNIPFPSTNQKPSRNEALEYYRRVAEHYRLDLRQYQTVEHILGEDERFTVGTVDSFGRRHNFGARKLIIATGYYDLPNFLHVPGEHLSKVLHYYHDPHPYFDQHIVVVGGKNSAAIAALDLWRHGAHVTLVHRAPAMHHHVKYWIMPDINNRIKAGQVRAYFSSSVKRITEYAVEIETPEGSLELKNDYVFAMTGYHPDFDFLTRIGVRLEGEDRCPACDPDSLESNIPGIYLAGVIVAGARTNEIFIENGRFHGRQIAQDLAGRASAKR